MMSLSELLFRPGNYCKQPCSPLPSTTISPWTASMQLLDLHALPALTQHNYMELPSHDLLVHMGRCPSEYQCRVFRKSRQRLFTSWMDHVGMFRSEGCCW